MSSNLVCLAHFWMSCVWTCQGSKTGSYPIGIPLQALLWIGSDPQRNRVILKPGLSLSSKAAPHLIESSSYQWHDYVIHCFTSRPVNWDFGLWGLCWSTSGPLVVVFAWLCLTKSSIVYELVPEKLFSYPFHRIRTDSIIQFRIRLASYPYFDCSINMNHACIKFWDVWCCYISQVLPTSFPFFTKHLLRALVHYSTLPSQGIRLPFFTFPSILSWHFNQCHLLCALLRPSPPLPFLGPNFLGSQHHQWATTRLMFFKSSTSTGVPS